MCKMADDGHLRPSDSPGVRFGPPEIRRYEQPLSDKEYYSRHLELDPQRPLHLYMETNFRYYFQHPYARLFVSYFVIFCNFLVFAEDPISHSRMESEIPVVGNVFSFVATKYPPQWGWCFFKVALWLGAVVTGVWMGKHVIHHLLLQRMLRLKMFRDESGTWMIMYLSTIVFVYLFSNLYNTCLLAAHPEAGTFLITPSMGVTNANVMKAAACGTWLGDFITAWMVTDMMLQDNLYPQWASPVRKFWRTHGRTRIVIFWAGSITMTALVVSVIVSDAINWDYLNRDFVATTELSRAFLASFILVMDLLIVMQDWDFPHFVCDLDIKLPGLHVTAFNFSLFHTYVNIPDLNFHISGKWFNYGIIVIVMILDLNMWKNQIFYHPSDYGQYTEPIRQKIYTVSDPEILWTGNRSLWTFEVRSSTLDPATNHSLLENDMVMNSRFVGYPMSAKGMAFVPSLLGFAMFGILTYLYGRFPPKAPGDTPALENNSVAASDTDTRIAKSRSSWRRERTNKRLHYVTAKKKNTPLQDPKQNETIPMVSPPASKT